MDPDSPKKNGPPEAQLNPGQQTLNFASMAPGQASFVPVAPNGQMQVGPPTGRGVVGLVEIFGQTEQLEKAIT